MIFEGLNFKALRRLSLPLVIDNQTGPFMDVQFIGLIPVVNDVGVTEVSRDDDNDMVYVDCRFISVLDSEGRKIFEDSDTGLVFVFNLGESSLVEPLLPVSVVGS